MNILGKLGRLSTTKILQIFVIKTKIFWYQSLSELVPKGKPKFIQPTLFMGQGIVEFGSDVKVGWKYSKGFYSGYTYVEARNKSAVITIGDGVHFNNGCSIICEKTSIEIGDNCLIGPYCEFMDSDFHSLEPTRKEKHIASSIILKKNVFLGANVVVLKGVTIGTNSVIGANSLVVSNIPANCIAAGNPAKVIKTLA
jgi:galactoside O-acetyltransferase